MQHPHRSGAGTPLSSRAGRALGRRPLPAPAASEAHSQPSDGADPDPPRMGWGRLEQKTGMTEWNEWGEGGLMRPGGEFLPSFFLLLFWSGSSTALTHFNPSAPQQTSASPDQPSSPTLPRTSSSTSSSHSTAKPPPFRERRIRPRLRSVHLSEAVSGFHWDCQCCFFVRCRQGRSVRESGFHNCFLFFLTKSPNALNPRASGAHNFF